MLHAHADQHAYRSACRSLASNHPSISRHSLLHCMASGAPTVVKPRLNDNLAAPLHRCACTLLLLLCSHLGCVSAVVEILGGILHIHACIVGYPEHKHTFKHMLFAVMLISLLRVSSQLPTDYWCARGYSTSVHAHLRIPVWTWAAVAAPCPPSPSAW